MLLSAVSVLVVAQSSSEIPEGLINNPVLNGGILKMAIHTPLSWPLAVAPLYAQYRCCTRRSVFMNSGAKSIAKHLFRLRALLALLREAP